MKQLLDDINKIAKPVNRQDSEKVMQAMIRLYEAKKAFPENRNEILRDAQVGKEFFIKGIEGHDQIIRKFEELSKLDITKADARCIEAAINNEHAHIESLENTISELEVLFDETVTDKNTLDLRSSKMRADSDPLKKKVDESEAYKAEVCSKSALGVD